MALQGVVMPSGPLITWTEKRSFTCTAMRCAVVQCTANTVLMCCRAASSVPNTGGQAAPHSSARNKDLQPSCMQLNLLQYSTRNIRGGRAILSSSQWIGAHEAYHLSCTTLSGSLYQDTGDCWGLTGQLCTSHHLPSGQVTGLARQSQS